MADQYVVVSDSMASELTKKVNELLDQGYVLYGKLEFATGEYGTKYARELVKFSNPLNEQFLDLEKKNEPRV